MDHASHWNPLRPLLGTWVGEGTGTPGEGTGGFSFAFDLDGQVLVRRNRADYPPSDGKPAYSHTDLLIVHPDPAATDRLRAIYFDNEGHIIQYTVTADAARIEFLSDPQPGQPRFRLTYTLLTADRLELTFEIAPPPTPDTFAPYITAHAIRAV